MKSKKMEGLLSMNFNEIYKKYDEVKSNKDYIEYENEMKSCTKILNSCPFDEQTARELLGYLVKKYGKELDCFAKLQRNGMTVSHDPLPKTPIQIWNDLYYVNGLIPLFALERKSITSYLKQQMQRGKP